MEDKRFDHIVKDPKYRKVPKHHVKLKIDGRFQSMFTEKPFQENHTTDKRGRPIKRRTNEDLKRFYLLSSDEGSDLSDSEENEDDDGKEASGSGSGSDIEEEEEKGANNEEIKAQKLPDKVKEKLRDMNIDYARGEKNLYSESSSDDEETDEETSDSEKIDHRWGELDADADQTNEATRRLAVCNLDWDRIRATDLMVLFNSFLPPSGSIKTIIIYPSEYGKQRLKEEEVKGPIELVESEKKAESEEEENNDSEGEEGSKYHMEKLRQYQLNRLKYYYAVITCDSANSANKIYTECDGMEYESSATKIDLRFIPDDMTFDDVPKEACDKLPDKYEPRFFTTTALQQAKVELTWDETNPDRLEFANKINSGKLDDISERDFKNYLASSSEEEVSTDKSDQSDSENAPAGTTIDKYKALLQDIQDKEKDKGGKDFEMEISWGVDLKAKTDKLMKEKAENVEDKNPFQKYLDKRKEKQKERRALKKKSKDIDNSDASDIPSDIDMNDPYFAEEFNNSEFKKPSKKTDKNNQPVDQEQIEEEKKKQSELDLILMDEEDRGHFNMKTIQQREQGKNKKRKTKKNKKLLTEEQQEDFEIDVEDKRFSALFTSHHFNIDPTDPHYKKTKAMESLAEAKLKRRNEGAQDGDNQSKKAKTEKDPIRNSELNMLVKNVKRKTQALKKK